MSDLLQKGVNILGRAEEQLRQLLGQAAQSGDYDSILVLTDWARLLRDLMDDGGGRGLSRGGTQPASQSGVTEAVPDRPDTLQNNMPHAPARPTGRAAGTRRTSSRRREYPKFLRDGDYLVKVGWSKSAKAPYEHRSPRRVLTLLLHAVQHAGRDGRRFTMDDVLPLKDAEDGTDIPTYQAYLCLAWLRVEQLIVQHGRQGYSLPSPAELDRQASERLQRLPQR